MTAKIQDLDIDYAISLRNEGFSLKKIAGEMGISANALSRRLAAAGEPRRNVKIHAFSEGEISQIITTYQSGKGYGGIAKDFGVAGNVINRVLRSHGIHIRNRSEQQQARMDNLSTEEKLALVKAANQAARGAKKSSDELRKVAATRFRTGHVGSSRFEVAVNKLLRESGYLTVTQMPVYKYNADIVVGDIAVEVHGGQWHWHGQHLARAKERLKCFFDTGYHVVFVCFRGRKSLTTEMSNNLIATIEELRSNESLARHYRVIGRDGQTVARGSGNTDNFSPVWSCRNTRDLATGRYISSPY